MQSSTGRLGRRVSQVSSRTSDPGSRYKEEQSVLSIALTWSLRTRGANIFSPHIKWMKYEKHAIDIDRALRYNIQTSTITSPTSTFNSDSSSCRGTNAITYTNHKPTEKKANLFTNRPPVQLPSKYDLVHLNLHCAAENKLIDLAKRVKTTCRG